jgi:hypothetical protein
VALKSISTSTLPANAPSNQAVSLTLPPEVSPNWFGGVLAALDAKTCHGAAIELALQLAGIFPVASRSKVST